MSMEKAADRWAFLEDIEAPMWVNLTLEAKLSDKELDDEWFHRSHKFHQLPSSKLKAAFKHVYSGGKLVTDIEGSSSPKIPSSVSKSRGKCDVNQKFGIDFQLSLSGKECLIEDADGKALHSQWGTEILPKSAQEDSKLSLHFDQENGSGSAPFKPSNTNIVPDTNNASSSNNFELNVGAKSSITSESSQMPGPEVVDASNRIIGRRGALLSVMKQSLRKSCAIRMATRGQITDVRQTNGLRSSSDKSSVGSCSVHSQDAKDIDVAGTQRASRTPESKNIERLSQESKTRGKVKTSTDGCSKYTNNTSGCGNSGEPLKLKAKPGSINLPYTTNRNSSSTSTSLEINTINRASECRKRGKVGILKVLKAATATRPTQLVNNNGSISKVSKSATVNTVPKHSTNRQKLIVPMGTRAIISNRTVSIEDGKFIVAKSTQPQVMISKALHVHRRPLAPVNRNDQGSRMRPLAPVKEVHQGSLTSARKATKKGKTYAATKSLCHGKENIVTKMVPSRKHENGQGIAAGGMGDKSNRLKLTEARKNNVHGLLSQ